MPRMINPARIAPPASRHSHGVVHGSRARRLLIAPQVGVLPDGAVANTFEAQIAAAWENIRAVLHEAGMSVHDLVRINVVVTAPGSVHSHREALEQVLGGHSPAISYMEVVALAQPAFLVAIDGEAVCEDPDALFEDMPGSGVAASSGRLGNIG